MSEYRFHQWPSGAERTATPSVELHAESQLHEAALALRHFMQLGCHITAPLAQSHDGGTHSLLVEEVLDWLNDPEPKAFVHREGLSVLFY